MDDIWHVLSVGLKMGMVQIGKLGPGMAEFRLETGLLSAVVPKISVFTRQERSRCKLYYIECKFSKYKLFNTDFNTKEHFSYSCTCLKPDVNGTRIFWPQLTEIRFVIQIENKLWHCTRLIYYAYTKTISVSRVWERQYMNKNRYIYRESLKFHE